MEQSKGHLCFIGKREYFRFADSSGESVYCANSSNPIEVGTGVRAGARFVCYHRSWGMARRIAEKCASAGIA